MAIKKPKASPLATVSRSKNTITANGGIVALDVYGESVFDVQITGDAVGTFQFEGSIDGVNYVAIPVVPISGGSNATSTTANGIWRGNASGLNNVRLRASAFTSGTATVVLQSAPSGTTGGPGSTTSVYTTKGTPTETAVTGSGSGTLIVATTRLSARATLISGSAWVSLTTPAPTAAPARLMNAGDVLYDDQTVAAWYYTAVGGTATFAVVVIA